MAGKQVCCISSMDEDDQLWQGNKSVASVPWMRTISCARETSLTVTSGPWMRAISCEKKQV